MSDNSSDGLNNFLHWYVQRLTENKRSGIDDYEAHIEKIKKWGAEMDANVAKARYEFSVKNHPANPNPVASDNDAPNGEIVYVPHDCVLPDPELHKVGTVFRCYAYSDDNRRMCDDYWELQNIRNHVLWVRVRPSWRERFSK